MDSSTEWIGEMVLQIHKIILRAIPIRRTFTGHSDLMMLRGLRDRSDSKSFLCFSSIINRLQSARQWNCRLFGGLFIVWRLSNV